MLIDRVKSVQNSIHEQRSWQSPRVFMKSLLSGALGVGFAWSVLGGLDLAYAGDQASGKSATASSLKAPVAKVAQAAKPAESRSRLVTYTSEDKTLFALSLLPEAMISASSGARVAVIVDTSASQNGDYRTDSIEVAEALVAQLGEDAKVALLACDVEPIVLSEADSATSSKISDGFAKLKKRVPLGTSDLASAFRAAVNALADGEGDINIVYIGDGVHLSNLMNASEFETLVNDLVAKHATVHSLAIGGQTDVEFLATIANHTGGRVLVRKNITNSTTQQIGVELANATTKPVFWPSEAKWPAGFAEVYPAKLPPLRLDRDSILVGKLKSEAAAGALEIQGTLGGKPVAMKWNLNSETSNEDMAFLTQIVAKAAPNAGIMLPTAGSDALVDLGIAIQDSSEQLVKEARFALHTGDVDAAVSIAKEALKRSPNNLAAKNILEAAQGPQKPVKGSSGNSNSKIVKFVSARLTQDPFETQPPASDEPASGDAPADSNPFGDEEVPAAPVAPAVINAQPPMNEPAFGGGVGASNALGELATAGDLLAENENLRRVAAQQMSAQVNAELERARRSNDPSGSKMVLKALLEQIRRAPELDPASRVRLESRVAGAIQSAAKAEATARELASRDEAVRSSASASKRLLAERERRSQTIQQLVERFNSLMDQQLYAAANNEIAPQIHALDPDSTIDIVTNLESNSLANFRLVNEVVVARTRAFVDSLYLNELATIPFVDEPPIRYPPADVWQALSARRLERYGTIDLSGGNEAERRIFRSLSSRGEVNFNAQPLSQVMKFFSDQYNIPIVIDDQALEEENITQEEPITINLPEVSFRSALKLILEPLNLTYVIEDEVMRITGKKDSANVVRVYPVGDLVVPIISGGGGMGGGMGGMGGGGMGGGGMMGGMGGGMMDVKDQPSKKPAAPKVDPMTLVDKIASSDGPARLDAEAELAKWVSNKMSDAKENAKQNKDAECRKNFEEVIEVVSEAMRRSMPAVWMYDALCTSMQACDYPGSEIRRVMLSSIDFGGDAEAAIKIADYLASRGMKKEALGIYRDAHRASPMLKEPLENGLTLALELGQQDAIQWACTGILGQAWTDDHLPLIEKASLAAQSSYIKLKQENRTMQAYVFKNEMEQAQVRDLVVRVSWTGDADIDISVEEPTGSICSQSNARTINGGLLLSDGSSIDKPSKDGFSETYVCANGYAGNYRILIHKVWGEVAGGKVTVNLVSDYGTKDQLFVEKQIPIERDALVIAEVKTGHRKEPIFEAQLAQVRKDKATASGAVLAQGAVGGANNGNFDSGSYYQQLLLAYANGSSGSGGNGNGGFPPFFRRGAVGYRPNIQVIPAGTFMTTTAVLSGDRRYVRVTPSPFFMDIVAVDTFNFVTGDTGAGGGGGLGGGAGGGGGLGGFGGGGAF